MSGKFKRIVANLLKKHDPGRRGEESALKWTYWALGLAFRSLWVSPVLWDGYMHILSHVAQTNFGWTLVRWVSITSGAAVFSFACMIQGWKQIIFMSHSDQDPLHLSAVLILSLLCSAHICFAVHAIFCFKSFPAILNIIIQLYKKFQNEYLQREFAESAKSKRDVLCCALIIASLLFVHTSPVVLVVVYILRCDMSVASMIFSGVCQGHEHASIALIPFWSVFQWGLLNIMSQSVLVYASLGTLAVVLMDYVVDPLSASTDQCKLKPAFRSHKHRIIVYRWIYLYCKYLDDFLHMLLPADITLVGLYFLTTSFYLVRMDLSLMHLVLGVACLVAMLNFLLMVYAGAVCTRLAQLKGNGIRASEEHQTQQIKASYRSCAPIKIRVGSFFDFSRHTPSTLAYRIVDILVTLLCAIPVTRPPLVQDDFIVL